MAHLVSVHWLKEHLADARLIVLDASLASSAAHDTDQKRLIPNSIFFDLDTIFSAVDSDLPHTMVSPDVFTQNARSLGINNEDTVVVYDSKGIYSSPRVWYMLRSMGFDAVSVLDGGLPEWIRAGFETVSHHKTPGKPGNFEAKPKSGFFVSKEQVAKLANENSARIIDARHPDRFNGVVDEPRKRLKRGHIPNSTNLYFEEVLAGNCMKPVQDLKNIFADYKRDEFLVFSCGSGVTACIDALAATIVGYENAAVYDGSWSEWGRRQ